MLQPKVIITMSFSKRLFSFFNEVWLIFQQTKNYKYLQNL